MKGLTGLGLLIIMCVLCLNLSGCGTDDCIPAGGVKVIKDGSELHFIWVDKCSGNIVFMTKSIDISVWKLEKLEQFADTLEKCSGNYEIAGTYDNGRPYSEIRKCGYVLPKSEMTHEFNNGYICKRCKKYRQEELKKKLESMK